MFANEGAEKAKVEEEVTKRKRKVEDAKVWEGESFRFSPPSLAPTRLFGICRPHGPTRRFLTIPSRFPAAYWERHSHALHTTIHLPSLSLLEVNRR